MTARLSTVPPPVLKLNRYADGHWVRFLGALRKDPILAVIDWCFHEDDPEIDDGTFFALEEVQAQLRLQQRREES